MKFKVNKMIKKNSIFKIFGAEDDGRWMEYSNLISHLKPSYPRLHSHTLGLVQFPLPEQAFTVSLKQTTSEQYLPTYPEVQLHTFGILVQLPFPEHFVIFPSKHSILWHSFPKKPTSHWQ
jgi:hypothetical protein